MHKVPLRQCTRWKSGAHIATLRGDDHADGKGSSGDDDGDDDNGGDDDGGDDDEPTDEEEEQRDAQCARTNLSSAS